MTPTAARCLSGLAWSTRFGLTTAKAAGSALLGRMMVDHDHLEPQLGRLAQRLERGGAGVQRDDQPAARSASSARTRAFGP